MLDHRNCTISKPGLDSQPTISARFVGKYINFNFKLAGFINKHIHFNFEGFITKADNFKL